ncbi:MAG: hypothetical protein CMD25_04875, partial [Flavobacteriales bacterium]|nr:hypothetical protein [Flavobacteriales bacterium]
MIKYTLLSALFLVGLANANETINKTDINKVIVMKSNEIFFELKNEEWYKGDILTPDCLRGKIYFDSDKTIHDSYKLQTHNG